LKSFGIRLSKVGCAAFERAVRCRGDRHQLRFIVTPEDAAEMEDLRSFTRECPALVAVRTVLEAAIDFSPFAVARHPVPLQIAQMRTDCPDRDAVHRRTTRAALRGKLHHPRLDHHPPCQNWLSNRVFDRYDNAKRHAAIGLRQPQLQSRANAFDPTPWYVPHEDSAGPAPAGSPESMTSLKSNRYTESSLTAASPIKRRQAVVSGSYHPSRGRIATRIITSSVRRAAH